jgi:hypothetical protein
MRRDDADEGEDARVERAARDQELVAGYRTAARRALELARLYRAEEAAAGGERERACIAQAQAWRRAVRDLHAGLVVPPLPRPGLARAVAHDAARGRKTG